MTRSAPAEIALRVATAAGAAALGFVDPSLAVAAAAGKEVVDAAAWSVWDRVNDYRRLVASAVFGIASEQAGLSPELLVERLSGNESTLLLMADTAEASTRTNTRDKMIALARVLANAATDPATVDLELVIVTTLARIDEPHIRLLRLVAAAPPTTSMQGLPVDVRGWRRAQLADASPGIEDALQPLLGTLQAAALIENVGSTISWEGSPTEDHQWQLTTFGRTCLDRLSEVWPVETAAVKPESTC